MENPLQKALNLFQAGQLPAAEQVCMQCLQVNARNYDAMQLLGMITKNSGDIDAALGWLRKSLELQPSQPHVWNNLGNIFKQMARLKDAASAYEHAIRLAPDYQDAWTNLGLALAEDGQQEEALKAYDRALTLAPQNSNTLNAKGQCLQAMYRIADAEETLTAAVHSAPTSVSALNNLGNVLRFRGKDFEAVEIFEKATRLMPDAGHLRVALAGALFSLGRFEEADKYLTDVITSEPDNMEAHRTLTNLLFTTDRSGEIPALYENTIAEYPELTLIWEEYVEALWLLDEYETGLEIAAKARAKCGERPRLRLITGRMLSSSGDPAEALNWLETPDRIDAPMERLFAIERARAYLRLGDYQTGADDIHQVAEKYPDDYSVLAHLESLWRMADDPRATWLLDYDHFVRPMEVPVPQGFRNHSEFNEELTEFLTALHVSKCHPIDQTLRGGTQTYGHLFERTEPIIRSLRGVIQESIQAFASMMKPDPKHPFLRHMGGPIAFQGSWSVRLRSEGFHVHHYHPEGWISSAYYVSLPPGVADPTTPDGRLQFGLPPVDVPDEVFPAKVIRPAVGILALFPSYCWHGTVPFDDPEPRLTVAFDVVRHQSTNS